MCDTLKMAKIGSKKGKKGKNNKKKVFAFFALFGFFASTFSASNPGGSSAQPQSTTQISNAGHAEPGACAECHREIAEGYARTAMARTFGIVRSDNEFPELKRGRILHRLCAPRQPLPETTSVRFRRSRDQRIRVANRLLDRLR
jgi:hypothetical protein